MREFEKAYKKNFKDEPGFVILAQPDPKSKDGPWNFYTAPEKHVLAMAASGGGKTQKIVLPSVYYNATLGDKAPTMLVIDPKGDVHQLMRRHLDNCGYKTYCLELRDGQRSDR